MNSLRGIIRTKRTKPGFNAHHKSGLWRHFEKGGAVVYIYFFSLSIYIYIYFSLYLYIFIRCGVLAEDGEEELADGQRRTPIGIENIQADRCPPQLVDSMIVCASYQSQHASAPRCLIAR